MTLSKSFPENLPVGWRESLRGELEKVYFKKLIRFLKDEWNTGQIIYPPRNHIFSALQGVDLPDVRVVILGQDPYHGENQATGFSFAVPNSCFPKPPSLQNIFKEIEAEFKISLKREWSDLSGWVKEGVLLLNSVLTVRANTAFSHRDRGWESFTDRVIELVDASSHPIVFLLWGAAAQKKKILLKNPRHLILESAHPSPLSAHRGFLGNRHFIQTNEFLQKSGSRPISWEKTSSVSQMISEGR